MKSYVETQYLASVIFSVFFVLKLTTKVTEVYAKCTKNLKHRNNILLHCCEFYFWYSPYSFALIILYTSSRKASASSSVKLAVCIGV